MIQANELRIGNWIDIDNGEKPRYHYQITAHDIEEIEGNGEDCFPIELSPAILVAAWFDNREGYLWFLNDDFYIHFRDGSLTYNGLPDGAQVIHYLHQLQNLYFALTGHELAFNPEKVNP